MGCNTTDLFIWASNQQSEKVSVPAEISETTKEIFNCHAPKQPILDEYPAKKFGNEPFARRFQPEWYKQ